MRAKKMVLVGDNTDQGQIVPIKKATLLRVAF